jgi:hypothetical protein
LTDTQNIISLPTAVLNKRQFHYQASLFWFAHKHVYKQAAMDKAMVLWAERNLHT